MPNGQGHIKKRANPKKDRRARRSRGEYEPPAPAKLPRSRRTTGKKYPKREKDA